MSAFESLNAFLSSFNCILSLLDTLWATLHAALRFAISESRCKHQSMNYTDVVRDSDSCSNLAVIVIIRQYDSTTWQNILKPNTKTQSAVTM